jgi:hypothetical protein
MTDRPEDRSAAEAVRPGQTTGKRAWYGAWSHWRPGSRVVWAVCAVAYAIFLVQFYWLARASSFTQWGALLGGQTPDKIIVSFRNDDLSVYSRPSFEDSVLSLFRSRGIKQTFAFIPNPAGYIGGSVDQPPRNSAIIDSLRQWERDGSIEFALHGFTHLKNNVGAGEFDGLPAETQDRMIREGKAILDSTLETNVRIFAPPWNQVDRHTVDACARAGIDVMSGYIGTPPRAGMMEVHSNAELFFHPGEIPPIDRVLELARSGRGTRFVNVFYHSRVDFPDPGTFQRVDSILSFLRSDPRVEILSLGQILQRYPDFLSRCSRSGWNVVEGENAMRFAKPYMSVFSRLPLVGKKVKDLEWRHQRALESYWSGDYALASLESGRIVAQSSNWLALGRLVALAGVLALLGIMYLTRMSRRLFARVSLVISVTIVLALISLVFATHISPDRIAEVERLALVFVGALLLILPWVRQNDSSNTSNL